MGDNIIKFPVVGVGASAGGIASYKEFLRAVPEKSGAAYILVQHLLASHESRLPEILSQATKIPIHEITDEMIMKPDRVYVLPENKLLEARNGMLILTTREQDQRHHPIDVFFSSLAVTYEERAIGVVLSGNAYDGTLGLKAIKDHGGFTFAEDPETAAHDGMPRSAIEAGVVDFIMAPGAIPAKLKKILVVYRPGQPIEEEQLNNEETVAFNAILTLLSVNRGIDLSYYKKPTLFRRISRRIAMTQTKDFRGYLKFLREKETEKGILLQDLLIQVTDFFRDLETFEYLQSKVFPAIFKHKYNTREPFRIWIPGCATGEEAYSIAICLHETLQAVPEGRGMDNRNIQIFATDISQQAIEKARAGIYQWPQLKKIPRERLRKYFDKINGEYKVKREIRDTVVFAVHNFLKDPPYARMDLISCRNVFIYMGPELQKRALITFHYALRKHGMLFLGKAESANAASDLFKPFANKLKFYSRKPGPGRFIPAGAMNSKKQAVQTVTEMENRISQPDFRQSAEAVLISKYTPVSVIVDQHLEVVHIKGRIAPYLEMPPGQPSHNLLKMVRNGLAFELRNALHKAKSSQVPVTKEGIPLEMNGRPTRVNIEVIPLLDTLDTYFLIIFESNSKRSSILQAFWNKFKRSWDHSFRNELQLRNQALERELAQARDDMRSISEEQESNNEELQSANEELLSSNEEMQSLNEELETSKEELQSTNEELITVNHELLERQEQLHESLSYSGGIIDTLREPFLVLDKDLKIRTANTSFLKKFEIDATDIEGKYLFSIMDGQWNNKELQTMLQKMLPEKESVVDFELELTFESLGSRTLHINAKEILQERKNGKWILFAIEDITDVKYAIENYKAMISELKQSNEQLDQFVHVVSHDLQEPLRKILTFSGRLIEDKAVDLAEDTLEYMKKIEKSSDRMSTLINDLLQFSRFTNQKELFCETDLNEVIGAVLQDFELIIEQKNGKLLVDNLPVIEAIPHHLEQVFYNLVGNALKFTDKSRPPVISIKSRKLTLDEAKKYPLPQPQLPSVELAVIDNGIGFNPKYAEQIFTIFQRLHAQDDFKGTGIGLAIVKKVVSNHNGHIRVESEEGKGTTFYIILPMTQPE